MYVSSIEEPTYAFRWTPLSPVRGDVPMAAKHNREAVGSQPRINQHKHIITLIVLHRNLTPRESSRRTRIVYIGGPLSDMTDILSGHMTNAGSNGPRKKIHRREPRPTRISANATPLHFLRYDYRYLLLYRATENQYVRFAYCGHLSWRHIRCVIQNCGEMEEIEMANEIMFEIVTRTVTSLEKMYQVAKLLRSTASFNLSIGKIL